MVAVSWSTSGLLVAMLVVCCSSLPSSFEKSDYDKVLQLFEAMAASKDAERLGNGDFGDGDLMRFANEYVERDYDPHRDDVVQQEVPNLPLEHGEMEVDAEWQEDVRDSLIPVFGQVGGLATDTTGDVIIFHRASRTWEFESFHANNSYAEEDRGPISEPTIFRADHNTGEITKRWGAKKFYMPHGLTIDHEGYYWVTDTAMHQVFKLQEGSTEPLLTLGKAFEPAEDDKDTERLCKPADVAVATTGDIYVADGYCNSRVVRYGPGGEYRGQLGEGDFFIPHSLALAEELDLICVADRENKRVMCFKAGLKERAHFGQLVREYGSQQPDEQGYLGRVYAIQYGPKAANSNEGQFLYGVSGPEAVDSMVQSVPQGFTIDLGDDDRYPYDVIARWLPGDKGFHEPHDLAVTLDGESLYVGELDRNTVWKFNKPDYSQEE